MNPWTLFGIFTKFGCICFGGGYVLIPLIIAEFVEKRHAIPLEDFGNLVSIAQVTPGPIGINSATYIGYIQGGVTGSLLASFGLILPSLIIGSTAVYSLARWKDSFFVKGLLRGVRPASLALLFFAVFLFAGMSVFTAPIPFERIFAVFSGHSFALPQNFRLSWSGLLICILSVILLSRTNLSTTTLIIASAIAGTVLCR